MRLMNIKEDEGGVMMEEDKLKFKKGDKIRFQYHGEYLYYNIVEVYENGYVVQETRTGRMGVLNSIEASWWYELVEDGNEEEKFVADLRELGCPVKFIFWETPEKPKPDSYALLQINDWLRSEKGVFVVGIYKMFTDNNNLSYQIKKDGRVIYQSLPEWGVGQKDEALYDGIKQAIRLLKNYAE